MFIKNSYPAAPLHTQCLQMCTQPQLVARLDSLCGGTYVLEMQTQHVGPVADRTPE